VDYTVFIIESIDSLFNKTNIHSNILHFVILTISLKYSQENF